MTLPHTSHLRARAVAASLALCACRQTASTTRPPAPAVQPVEAPAARPVDAPAPVAAPAPPPPRVAANCSGTRQETMGAECWFPGVSCEGRGGDPPEPFAIHGTVVEGGSVHGGCNPTTFALVYERGPTTLRLRVCARPSAPMDCPAMMVDRARWDIAPLLAETGLTRAVIVRANEAGRRSRR